VFCHWILNVIGKRGLNVLLNGKSADVTKEVNAWYKVARAARWVIFEDVRETYPSADQVGTVLIFNIRQNRYRLITVVVYGKQKLYLKALLTHKEYDRKEWKKWA
jgi:mRNA interferase HigB